MSRDHSLALSQEQTSLFRAVADSLQAAFRRQFFAGVVDNLMGCGHLTDVDALRAIDSVQETFVVDDDDCC